MNWKRHSDMPLFSSEEVDQWYGKSSLLPNHFHWRDPYLLKDSKTGKYYLFICAYSKTARFSLIVAVLALPWPIALKIRMNYCLQLQTR